MSPLARSRNKVLAFLLFPAVVLAHGGEAHGAQPQAAPLPAAAGASVEGASDRFEALLRLDGAAEPGKALAARLFLADASTNAPISSALLEISLSGPSSETVTSSAPVAAGVYPIKLPALQAGDYDVTVSIESGGGADLLMLDTLKVSVPGPELVVERSGSSIVPWMLLALVLVAIAPIVFLLALALRRRRRAEEVPS